MKNYKITIKGGGTAEQISKALKQIAKNIDSSIQSTHEEQLLDGAEWEDPILMTEIDGE